MCPEGAGLPPQWRAGSSIGASAEGLVSLGGERIGRGRDLSILLVTLEWPLSVLFPSKASKLGLPSVPEVQGCQGDCEDSCSPPSTLSPMGEFTGRVDIYSDGALRMGSSGGCEQEQGRPLL